MIPVSRHHGQRLLWYRFSLFSAQKHAETPGTTHSTVATGTLHCFDADHSFYYTGGHISSHHQAQRESVEKKYLKAQARRGGCVLRCDLCVPAYQTWHRYQPWPAR